MTLGAIPGPHDAALILRGLRTLKLRMQRVAETTPRIAAFLAAHPRVARVWYPHAPDHPQRALVARQMRASSGLVSFALKDTDAAAIARFCDALQRFLLAVSWGGYESLVCPLVAFLPVGAPLLQQPGRAPPQLIRLSIGLEDAEVLIADLEQALDRACDTAATRAGVAP
jgi:cystathionine beta-lyase/cystathionine gamma-synthase